MTPPTIAARDTQLQSLADLARKLVTLIDAPLFDETNVALAEVGWGPDDTADLKADLLRAADHAKKAKGRTAGAKAPPSG
jgi:hypothetical protein